MILAEFPLFVRTSHLSGLLLAILLVTPALAGPLSVIPAPVSVKMEAGEFVLRSDTKIVVPAGNAEAKSVADLLSETVAENTGVVTVVDTNAAEKGIRLSINAEADVRLGDEGYTLDVTTAGVEIRANKPAGLFYGTQTLIQMIPLTEKAERKAPLTLSIPAVKIVDYPRLSWRGLLLDLVVYYRPKEFIKRYIDQMSRYKLNTLVLSLAEDCGWRLEIKSLPKLTEIGAWRVPRTGKMGYFAAVGDDEPRTEGGFYTQDNIRELVTYAEQRSVTLVPLLDFPGHTSALIASYPELSCSGVQYPTYSGTRGDLKDSVICVAKENTYAMLDKIFTEVAALFPGKYIHAGGDEVDFSLWNKDPGCKALMDAQPRPDAHGLQTYFTKRLNDMLAAKGKSMIGWDEILEGGDIPKGITINAWRGVEKGQEAIKEGHPVIMVPIEHYYLDHLQSDPAIDIYGAYQTLRILRLSDVYAYDPVPEGVDPKTILGAQGNVWTGRMQSERRVEYFTWPRALALAETFWSPKREKNFAEFSARIEAQFPRFTHSKVSYAPSIFDPIVTPSRDANGNLQVTFSSEKEGLDIYYTYDCTYPDEFASRAIPNEPMVVPHGADDLSAITYRDGKPIGRLLRISMRQLESRL